MEILIEYTNDPIFNDGSCPVDKESVMIRSTAVEERPWALVPCLTLVLALAFVVPAVPAASLYGVTGTDDLGDVDVVLVDPASGLATLLFTVNVGPGNSIGSLAYHATTGTFLTVLADVDVARIDPVLRTVSAVDLDPLPGSDPNASGIVYDTAHDRIVMCFADDGSFAEDCVAEITLDGSVPEAALDIADDIDAIGFDPVDGNLLGVDFNATTDQRVFHIAGLFDEPSLSTIATPEARGDVGDIAVEPETGTIYVCGFSDDGGMLLRLTDTFEWEDLGDFGASRQLVGLAFGDTYTPVPGDHDVPALASPQLTVAPNPFNPTTRISFELPEPSPTWLSVVDLTGRRVATLRRETLDAGRHEVDWRGTDDDGRRLASGTYLLRLDTSLGTTARPVVLLK
jgi:hypothetical protein